MRRVRDRGQSIVELAMLLPLLLLIVLGCLDLGRVFFVWIALANGTREGARFASTSLSTLMYSPTSLEIDIKRDIVAEGLDGDDVDVSVDAPDGPEAGLPVQVTASYKLPLLTTFIFGGQPVLIKANAEMVIFGG